MEMLSTRESEVQHPGFFTGFLTTCYFTYNKISESQKEKRSHVNPTVGTLRHFYHLRKEGISSKVQVPRSQLRVTLQAGLSVLILSYTTGKTWWHLGAQGPQLHCICCYVPAPVFRIPLLSNQCNVVRLRIGFHCNSVLIK